MGSVGLGISGSGACFFLGVMVSVLLYAKWIGLRHLAAVGFNMQRK
jgi:hypothetical protein